MGKLAKWGIGIGALVLVAVVGAGLWVRTQLDPEHLRDRAQQIAGDTLGRTVTIGSADISWSGQVVLDKVAVSGAGGKGTQLEIKAVRASVALASIANGVQAIQAITIEEPRISIARRADGSTDIDDVMQKLAHSPASGPMTVPPTQLQSGQATVSDGGSGRTWHADGLELSISQAAAGALSLSGDVAVEHTPMHIDGDLNPSTRTFAIRNATARVEGIDLAASAGTLTGAPTGPTLSPTAVTIAGQKGTLALAVAGGGALTGSLALPSVDLATVRQGLAGTANVHVNLGGTIQAPRIDGEAAVSQVTAALPGIDPKWGAKIVSGSVRFSGDQIKGEKLVAEFLGKKFTPKLTIVDLFKDPKIDFDSTAVSVDVREAASLLSARQRKDLERFAPEGTIAILVRASGRLRKPTIQGGATIAHAAVKVPGLPDPVSIEKGALKFAGDRIDLAPTRLVARSASLTVSGHVEDIFGSRNLDLVADGHHVALGPFVDLLPPGLARRHPELVADVSARVAGTASAPVVRGEIHPISGSMALGGGDGAGTKVLRIRDGGSIILASGLVKVESLPLAVDAVSVVASAGAQVTGERARIQTLSLAGHGVHLTGRGTIAFKPMNLESVELAGDADIPQIAPSSTVAGVVHLQIGASGPPDAPSLTGQATSESLAVRLQNGGSLALTKLFASIEGTPHDLAVSSIRGRFCGGDLSGQAHIHPGVPTSFSADLTGAAVSTLLRDVHSDPQLAKGSATVHFEGKAGGGGLEGVGTLHVASLVVDASRTAAVRQARATLDKGARTAKLAGGVGVALGGLDAAGGLGKLSGLLGQKGVAGLASGGVATVQYYTELLDELGKPQSVGTVKAPIKAQGGVVALSPVTGDNIAGNVRVAMAGLGLSGEISILRLGKVEIRDVTLGGTLSDPSPHTDLSKVTLAGRPAPKAATGAAGVLGGGAKLDLKSQLRKQAAKSLKGNPLGALLGGDDQDAQDQAPPASPPPQQQPQSVEKKVVNKLLKGLFH